MHKFFIILGISILLFKLSVFTKFEEKGTLGLNEKRIILEYTPIPVYNFFLTYGNPLVVPNFIKFNEETVNDEIEQKELKNLGIFDVENWKSAIKFIAGTIYFMFLIYTILIFYKILKEAIISFYKINRAIYLFFYKIFNMIFLFIKKIFLFIRKRKIEKKVL